MPSDPLLRLRLFRGNITSLDQDAIVTAANEALRGGGGVDGAIHRAAGPELLAACQQIGGCPCGEARITPGFRLTAKFVVHAVGPVYRDGRSGEEALLRSAYQSSLRLAAEHDLQSLAFPCISTGVYGYPLEEACPIAIQAVVDWLRDHDRPSCVTFCCFDALNEDLYRRQLAELGVAL